MAPLKSKKLLGRQVLIACAGVVVCLLFHSVAFAQLADSPWPSFQNDAYNTGLSQFAGPQSDSLRWTFQTDGTIRSSPAIGKDGTVYFGSLDQHIYALHPDGTLKWKYKTEGEIQSSPALGADGTVYIGSDDNHLYALSTDGSLKWKYKTAHSVESNPVIGDSGTIYVSSLGYLYAISEDGTELWKNEIEDAGITGPALDSDGTLYVGADAKILTCGAVHAVNVKDGTEDWWECAVKGVMKPPTIGNDTTIYVGSKQRYGDKYGSEDRYVLHALNEDKTRKWTYGPIKSIQASPAIGPNGNVYAGSGAGIFYAVGPGRDLQWSYETEGAADDHYIYSSPAVDSNGVVYFGSSNNYIYALNADGTLKWKYNTGDRIVTSPAIGANGTIYIASDSSMYAIGQTTTTSIGDHPDSPTSFELKQNYPNPFNPTTNIQFELPEPTEVRLTVYNRIGQKVSTLINQKMGAGSHSATFDAPGLPSGVYIYRLKADGFSKSRKMLLVK